LRPYSNTEAPLLREFYRTLEDYDRRIIIILDTKGECAHADLFAKAFSDYLREEQKGVAAVTFGQTKNEMMMACLEDRDYCFFDVYSRYYSSKHISRMSQLIDDCMLGRKTHFRSKFESKFGHEGDGPRFFIFCTNDLDNLWFISCYGRDHASIIDVSDLPDIYGEWNITPKYLGERFDEIRSEART